MLPEERPIFIVGVHRSGTSLLRYMLNSSPRIYIAPESDFIPRFFLGKPQQELDDEAIDSLLQTIFSEYNNYRSEWQGELPEASAFVEAMPDRTPTSFLATLYGTYAEQHQAERWGDKTPIYASYMDLIDRLFPNAQFIHIIRDGRDAALSMLDKWADREFHVDPFFAARNWVRRIRRAQASGARLGPDRYCEVRYEALVADPDGELAKLCQFLDEPYRPQMARPQVLGRQTIEPGSWNEPIRHPPSTARIGRWREDLSLADQRLTQRIEGKLLLELGYQLEELGPMPWTERLRLAALALKYVSLQAGRRVLQEVGLFPPI
jgi:hypothetical protein